jgi:Transposase domain (DUF772)
VVALPLEQEIRVDVGSRSSRSRGRLALRCRWWSSGNRLTILAVSRIGRPGVPPEKLLRALLLQAFYSIRSERQLMERLDFDLLFRWFLGLGMDDPVCSERVIA